jgi:hypothetical protein
MTFLSSSGLSIVVYRPLILGGDHIGDFTEDVNSYTHTISASGGFTSASFTTTGNEIFAGDWLEYGLGRHIVVHGSSLEIVWEGFVNQIEIDMGGVSFSRGPLTNLGNRVMGTFTEIIQYEDGREDVTGGANETLVVDNEDSQSRYGIWEKIINVGTALPIEADYTRDLFLVENCNPEGIPTINLGGTGEISITVQCRGYIDWLDYIYNVFPPETPITDNYSVSSSPSSSVSASPSAGMIGWMPLIWASDKIIAILEEDPNHIIDTFYDKIYFNGVIVLAQELDNRTAKTIIDEILTLGGGNDDRWTFGIYANRKPVYQQIPTEVEYIYHKNAFNQAIETISGDILKPWNILPCKWIAVPDVLSSKGINVSTIDDPRIFFAEEVTYTAPDQLSISGAKVRKLEQYLAKLGLGGG